MEEIGRHNTTPAGVWGEGGDTAAFSVIGSLLEVIVLIQEDHDPSDQIEIMIPSDQIEIMILTDQIRIMTLSDRDQEP